MQSFTRLIGLFIIIVMIISGCTITPINNTAPTIAQSWEEQQQTLAPLIYWNIAGKLGIKTKDESHSTLMNWQQQADQYAIAITSPIGTSVAHIDGNAQSVQLKLRDNKIHTADSLDELLWNQLGWTLPADQLFYWVRGLPAPTAIDSQQLNAQHQLTQLEQSGWSIQYIDYMNADGYNLPKKMVLSNTQLKLTLFISEWRIAESALPSP